jgi:hypothetical protein
VGDHKPLEGVRLSDRLEDVDVEIYILELKLLC